MNRDIDILGQSTSSAAANDLRIGGIVGNVSGSGTTVLDGVWSTGVIATKQGSRQDVFYAGGLVGGHDSGTLQILRSFSTANVSSQGSHSGKMALGGLLGDSGDNNGTSGIGGSAQHLLIDRSYATGSIVEGTYDGYYGSGGLVGVIYGDSATLTDSFSRSNVVGGISSGGIAGFSAPGTTKTYQRLYTTMNGFGNLTNPTDSYHSGTLDTATNNGTQLPSGWSSDIWNVGELPTLKSVGVPASLLYVQVLGGTGVYGDLATPTYQIVDADGNVVTLGSGDYAGLDGVSGTGRYTLGQFTSAGNYNNVSYLSGLGFTGDDANLFALNPFTTSGSFTITPRSITAVLANTGVDKVYDGNVNAGSGYTPTWSFTNIVLGDSATLNTGSMFFNAADVLDANLFTINGLSLAGISGSNGSVLGDYSLANTTASVAANITPKPIVINGLFANDKIYDGTTTASIDSSGVNFSGLVSGDSVTITGLGGTFTDKNAGTDKNVNVVGSFTGADASNYSASLPSTLMADITPKAIATSGIISLDRIYDGTISAVVDTSGVSFDGMVAGDTLTIADTIGTYADKNVGTGKTVALSGSTYGGADAGNYSITGQVSTTSDVTTKALIVDLQGQGTKIYDGTTTLDFSGITPTLTGIIGGDSVTVVDGTVTGFSDKNVGTNKSVDYSGFSITGADASNYQVTVGSAPSTAAITAKSVVISGLAGIDQVYDGTTRVSVDHSGVNFAGIVSGDSLTASGTTGSMADRHVGSGKSISLSGTTYGGTDVGNYTFTDQSTASVNITPKAVTVSGITAAGKVYDATTSATVNGSGVTFSGLVSGDDLSIDTLSGSFNDKNVAAGKTVNLSATYTGTEAGNYSITDQATATADITPKSIIVSGLSADNRIYDGTTSATVDHSGVLFSGIISGDDLTASGTTGVFSNRNVANGIAVTLSGTTYGGTDVGNYSFTDQTFDTANITPKAIVVSGITAANKVYDALTTATVSGSAVTFDGIVSGDDLGIDTLSGSFADKNVANGKAVNLATTYTGADLGNYTITDQATTTANITPKAIVVSGITAGNKVYDGTMTAAIDGSGVTFGGLISGDDLSIDTLTGLFTDKNAANGKTVNLSTTYTGTDVGNYAITNQATTTADITAKSIVVSGLSAIDKIYDGTTGAAVDHSSVMFGGIVSGDDLTATGTTGTFSNKNVATGKTVTLNGTNYGGADVGNYSFTDQTSSTADITPKAIVVTGITADNRVYDGTTAVTVDGSGVIFGGIISGDDVAIDTLSGLFGDKNVATNKTVNLATTYTGTDFGNYAITDQTTTTANITPKSIVVNGITAANKVYDGTTAVIVDGSTVTFGGLISGDDVSIDTLSGLFSDKNVASNKSVNLSTTYTGTDVGNYTINDQASAVADVTQKAIFITGLVANDKVYDGTTNGTINHSNVAFNGIVSGDDLTASGTIGTFTDKNVATNKAVILSGTTFGGTDVGNYSFTDQTSSTASITPKAITVNGITAADKTYDGNTTATVDGSGVNFDGLVSGDDLTIDTLSGLFTDKNVATDKTVNLSTTYTGTDVGNYTIADQPTTNADIARLGSVMWIGGPTGDWSDPANWAGGAIPDLGNVANVIIPNGVTPLFDDGVSGPVDIDSLTGGNLQVDGGVLNVADDATLNSYTQNDGDFEVGGSSTFETATINDGNISLLGDAEVDTLSINGGSILVGGNLEVGDITVGSEASVSFGGLQSNEFMKQSAEATSSSVRDTNTRYTEKPSGFQAFVERFSPAWLRTALRWAGFSTRSGQVSAPQVDTADGETFIRSKSER
ncbi:MAG: beta strand repeat-containing protein [Planctomycetaceae bacterium]